MEKVVIIGIGLIGGSFAKGIKRLYPNVHISGLDVNKEHLDEAQKLGLIDSKASDTELSEADMVLVTIPVDVMVNELPRILDRVNDECVVMDAGSTKAQVCQEVANHTKRRNSNI